MKSKNKKWIVSPIYSSYIHMLCIIVCTIWYVRVHPIPWFEKAVKWVESFERETRILHVELNSERKSRQRDMLCVSQHKVETQSPVVTSKTNTLPQLYCDWRDTIKRYQCRVRYLLCHPLEINDPIKHLAYGVSPSQWTMQLTLLFSIAQPLQRLLFCCLGPSWSALLAWS